MDLNRALQVALCGYRIKLILKNDNNYHTFMSSLFEKERDANRKELAEWAFQCQYVVFGGNVFILTDQANFGNLNADIDVMRRIDTSILELLKDFDSCVYTYRTMDHKIVGSLVMELALWALDDVFMNRGIEPVGYNRSSYQVWPPHELPMRQTGNQSAQQMPPANSFCMVSSISPSKGF